MAAYPAVFEQAQALTGVSSTPLVVVTATAGDTRPGWPAAQDALAELSPTSCHRLVPATHASLQRIVGSVPRGNIFWRAISSASCVRRFH